MAGRARLDWQDVDSTFYSDSMNDVPLLEKVDHPVATNPDARLRALARSAAGASWTCFTPKP
jgi:phosphoserine phosphatase